MEDKLQEIFDNKPLLEKFMLAWYLSVPSDNSTAPYKIVIRDIDKFGIIHYNKLNSKNVVTGLGLTTAKELMRYYKSIDSILDAEAEIFGHKVVERDEHD